MCVFVCVCVRACVRAFARACVRAFACVCVSVCVHVPGANSMMMKTSSLVAYDASYAITYADLISVISRTCVHGPRMHLTDIMVRVHARKCLCVARRYVCGLDLRHQPHPHARMCMCACG